MRAQECPRCDEQLREVEVSPHGLLGCASCGGVFLSHSAVRVILTEGHDVLESTAAQFARVATSRPLYRHYAPCCICAAPMARVDLLAPGTAAYTCNMHGSWFEGGDVSRLRGAMRGVTPPPTSRTHLLIGGGAEAPTPPRLWSFPRSTASLVLRLGASVLDNLFLLPSVALVLLLSGGGAPEALVLIGGGGAVVASLGAQMYWASTTGQTFGKRKCRIRVVRADGSPAGAMRILVLRNIVPYVVLPLGIDALTALLALGDEDAPTAFVVLSGIVLIPLTLLVYGGWLLVLLPARRALHDYIAGTIVVPA